MAVYKFRVIFEDDTDVIRDIEIKSEQTFLDLHNAILNSINFQANELASFYITDDTWRKGKEIALMDMSDEDTEKENAPLIMSKCEIADFIEDPHQKFIYVFDFLNMWTFMIELIKINPKPEPKVSYPRCIKSEGVAPKQFKNKTAPALDEEDELDGGKKRKSVTAFSEMGGIEEFGDDDDLDLEGEEGDDVEGDFDEFSGGEHYDKDDY